MTAEIAILNKSAVALAADSAVTIGGGRNAKIFNTVNKLFALSKHQPFGIMIYGNAQLMSMPWESIIKIYRDKLDRTKKFNTVKELGDDFISFLANDKMLFSDEDQKEFFKATVGGFLKMLFDDAENMVKEFIALEKKIGINKIKEIYRLKITRASDDWEKTNLLPNGNKAIGDGILKKYDSEINDLIKNIFGSRPLSKDLLKKLRTTIGNLFIKQNFSRARSGVVIAGFGEKEIFPSLESYTIECKVGGHLKYIASKPTNISRSNPSAIMPFAQREMVDMFMTGVDPSYDKFMNGYLNGLFNKYPQNILEILKSELTVSDAKSKSIETKLKKLTAEIGKDFANKTGEYRREALVNPIVGSVSMLPKEELALMAESLVNLTVFKQKISVDLSETVGGPIDVAIISKGDGFIWIKRKHYFKPELNHQFFSNYTK